MPTSALRLAADLEKFLASQVQQGTYRTRVAAIAAAVAHEKCRAEQRAWLQGELQKGLDSGSAGELDMASVIRRGRSRLATRKRRARG
jgi:Arc/MetJ-type ribon-helix-helix transcriptional regulator